MCVFVSVFSVMFWWSVMRKWLKTGTKEAKRKTWPRICVRNMSSKDRTQVTHTHTNTQIFCFSWISSLLSLCCFLITPPTVPSFFLFLSCFNLFFSFYLSLSLSLFSTVYCLFFCFYHLSFFHIFSLFSLPKRGVDPKEEGRPGSHCRGQEEEEKEEGREEGEGQGRGRRRGRRWQLGRREDHQE